MAMHLAESSEELELLRSGSGPFRALLEERSMWDEEAILRGSRPMHYLRMLADTPRALIIHGNYLENDEWDFIAAQMHKMSVVHCPRTHAYFRHPPFPVTRLLASGVRVALGTDSRASNPDLNLLAEIRQVARLFPTLDPEIVLRMGTLNGAEALGRAKLVGSISPGKLANLVAVRLPADARGAASELLTASFAQEHSQMLTWMRGTVVAER
jgi:cytosine/adenosine deaminase-related metal-dependent hydrolase